MRMVVGLYPRWPWRRVAAKLGRKRKRLNYVAGHASLASVATRVGTRGSGWTRNVRTRDQSVSRKANQNRYVQAWTPFQSPTTNLLNVSPVMKNVIDNREPQKPKVGNLDVRNSVGRWVSCTVNINVRHRTVWFKRGCGQQLNVIGIKCKGIYYTW